MSSVLACKVCKKEEFKLRTYRIPRLDARSIRVCPICLENLKVVWGQLFSQNLSHKSSRSGETKREGKARDVFSD